MNIRQSVNYVYSLTLSGRLLQVDEEKDLGATVCDHLESGSYVKHITAKANQRTGLIKRCFESRTEKLIKTLYDYMMRSVLGYASPAWKLNKLKKFKREL